MNVTAHFKVKGATRKWDKGSITKFYVDIDKGSDYPSIGEFEIFGDKINLDQYSEGDKINVFFNIKGRKAEWKGADGSKKSGFFQSLQAWKIEKVDGGSNESAPVPISEDDTLPF